MYEKITNYAIFVFLAFKMTVLNLFCGYSVIFNRTKIFIKLKERSWNTVRELTLRWVAVPYNGSSTANKTLSAPGQLDIEEASARRLTCLSVSPPHRYLLPNPLLTHFLSNLLHPPSTLPCSLGHWLEGEFFSAFHWLFSLSPFRIL